MRELFKENVALLAMTIYLRNMSEVGVLKNGDLDHLDSASLSHWLRKEKAHALLAINNSQSQR